MGWPTNPTISPSNSFGGFHQTWYLFAKQEFLLRQCFDKHVRTIIFYMHLLKCQKIGIQYLPNPMIPYINVLRSRLKCRILTQINITLTVTVKTVLLFHHTQLIKKFLQPKSLLACFSGCDILCLYVWKRDTFLQLILPWYCSLCKNHQVPRCGLPVIEITYHICISVPI